MNDLRADARRARSARRSAAPARVTFPLLSAVVVIAAAAVVATEVGLPFGLVLVISALVAIGGAVAAHRTVATLAAGVTLLVVRPYAPGEPLRLYSPEQGRFVDAEIVRVGLANTTLATASGLLVVPNSRLLRDSP